MRCPKCGAFLEQEKVICNMCGTNATTYVPEQTNTSVSDGMFSTGMNTGNGDFSSAPPATNKYASVSAKKDYHNVELRPVKNGEKDIFDFFSENKKLLSFLGILLVFGIIAFAGWKYYEHKNKPPVIEPVFRNLYYEVDKSFETNNYNLFMDIKNIIIPEDFLTLNEKYREIWKDMNINFIIKNIDNNILLEKDLLRKKEV